MTINQLSDRNRKHDVLVGIQRKKKKKKNSFRTNVYKVSMGEGYFELSGKISKVSFTEDRELAV